MGLSLRALELFAPCFGQVSTCGRRGITQQLKADRSPFRRTILLAPELSRYGARSVSLQGHPVIESNWLACSPSLFSFPRNVCILMNSDNTIVWALQRTLSASSPFGCYTGKLGRDDSYQCDCAKAYCSISILVALPQIMKNTATPTPNS